LRHPIAADRLATHIQIDRVSSSGLPALSAPAPCAARVRSRNFTHEVRSTPSPRERDRQPQRLLTQFQLTKGEVTNR
jgi:hypothetical protein